MVLSGLVAVRLFTAHAADDDPDNGYSEIAMFAKAVELIRQDYVDGSKTSYHDLFNAAMKGMLSSLDPHSQFMDPDDFKDMQDDTRSRFNGLGHGSLAQKRPSHGCHADGRYAGSEGGHPGGR